MYSIIALLIHPPYSLVTAMTGDHVINLAKVILDEYAFIIYIYNLIIYLYKLVSFLHLLHVLESPESRESQESREIQEGRESQESRETQEKFVIILGNFPKKG